MGSRGKHNQSENQDTQNNNPFRPRSTLFFHTDYFIQFANQDTLCLPALLAGLQVSQEGRNIQASFPGLNTQLGGMAATYKMTHTL
jgi:hypothetical protein